MWLKPLVLLSAFLMVCLAPAAVAKVNVGDPAPDFTLNDVDGVPHSLSDFVGKVILLNFWQSG